jgi:hypothetical protein
MLSPYLPRLYKSSLALSCKYIMYIYYKPNSLSFLLKDTRRHSLAEEITFIQCFLTPSMLWIRNLKASTNGPSVEIQHVATCSSLYKSDKPRCATCRCTNLRALLSAPVLFYPNHRDPLLPIAHQPSPKMLSRMTGAPKSLVVHC